MAALPEAPEGGKQEGRDTQTEEMVLTNMQKWICYAVLRQEHTAMP